LRRPRVAQRKIERIDDRPYPALRVRTLVMQNSRRRAPAGFTSPDGTAG